MLWCGLDEAVVSKPMAGEVLNSHDELVGVLREWAGISEAVSKQNFNLQQDEGEWDNILASAEEAAVPVGQRRMEAAGLATIGLPCEWTAIAGGTDMLGLPRGGDILEVTILTGSEDVDPNLRMQKLTEFRKKISATFNIPEANLTLSDTGMVIDAPPNKQDNTMFEIRLPQTPMIGSELLRLQAMGLTITAVDEAANIIKFSSLSMAVAFLINTFVTGCCFEKVPGCMTDQPIHLRFSDKSSFRRTVLLRTYLQTSDHHTATAKILRSWGHAHGIVQFIPVEGLLVMLAHYLVVCNRAVFIPPNSIVNADLGAIPVTTSNVDMEEVKVILAGFFDYFSKFEWGTSVVTIHEPPSRNPPTKQDFQIDEAACRKTLFKTPPYHVHTSYCIVDPFSYENLGSKMSPTRGVYFSGVLALASFIANSKGGAGLMDVNKVTEKSILCIPLPPVCFSRELLSNSKTLPDITHCYFLNLSGGSNLGASGNGHCLGVPNQTPSTPISPSYTQASKVQLKRKSSEAVLKDTLNTLDLWDSSPSDSPGQEPPYTPLGLLPGSALLGPPADHCKSVEEKEQDEGLNVDALVGTLLNREDTDEPQQMSEHVSLYSRGALMTPIGASPLPPLVSPGPVSPCSILSTSFGFPTSAQSPGTPFMFKKTG
eukprot:TRINITY_DN4033_c0_g1_i5.p1 TRINITY_DN4033_c0_g1~~TRINITY_DN4033_c0_g1_i5.p1  ORF type:complete len:654 (+),score=71.03 TRINITY_DN4033_c0_g1_i5:45-2006(+)